LSIKLAILIWIAAEATRKSCWLCGEDFWVGEKKTNRPQVNAIRRSQATLLSAQTRGSNATREKFSQHFRFQPSPLHLSLFTPPSFPSSFFLFPFSFFHSTVSTPTVTNVTPTAAAPPAPAVPQKDFVPLHVHTGRSLLDGCCRVDRLVERAAAFCMCFNRGSRGSIQQPQKTKPAPCLPSDKTRPRIYWLSSGLLAFGFLENTS